MKFHIGLGDNDNFLLESTLSLVELPALVSICLSYHVNPPTNPKHNPKFVVVTYLPTLKFCWLIKLFAAKCINTYLERLNSEIDEGALHKIFHKQCCSFCIGIKCDFHTFEIILAAS